MRKVYEAPTSAVFTPRQKRLREWLDEDLKGFFKELAKLEGAYPKVREAALAQAKDPEPPPVKEPCNGSARG